MERRKRIILDTHIWIKLAQGDRRIRNKFKKFLDGSYERCLSVFSVWEFAMLVSKKRFILEEDPLEWVKDNLKQSQLTLLPLSLEIAVKSCFLSKDFHGDPGDRIILATSIVEDIILLTEDKKIIRYLKKTH